MLQGMLIDLATVNKCAVGTAKIYQADTSLGIHDQCVMPAYQRIGQGYVTQWPAADKNVPVIEYLLFHHDTMHSRNKTTD